MNKKLLICIGFLMFFSLVLCNEDVGQGDEPSQPSKISVKNNLD